MPLGNQGTEGKQGFAWGLYRFVWLALELCTFTLGNDALGLLARQPG